MGFTGAKAIWKSKTIWAGIITIASAMSGLAGIDFPKEDLSQLIYAYLANHNTMALIGGIMAIVGRIVADSKITLKVG